MTAAARFRGRASVHLLTVLAAFHLISGGSFAAAPAPSTAPRRTFANSIQSVPTEPTDASGRPHRAFVRRAVLQTDETTAPLRFEVALAMRNFDELEARLAHSEVISPAEMQARYLPLAADHDRVVRWLQAEGMTVTRTDANRLAIFARGSVAEVGRVFQTAFARVAADGNEFTSAVAAPSVPAELAPAIRGIHGLQPYQRLKHRPHALEPLAGTGNSLPYYPAQIAQAYNATNLGVTGAGQTIAIYALGYPAQSDLDAFWSAAGVPATAASIQRVDVAGGPSGPGDPNQAGYVEEATLDVEWASALAPGATIRIYAGSGNDPVSDDELIQQILADLPTQPALHQLTISYGLDENAADRDYIAIEAQYMAALVSQGVTVFAASGDNGALDNFKRSIQTGIPASMPDVTGVGGTTLNLDPTGAVSSEIAWGSLSNAGTTGGSGGGISVIFNRPGWQNVAGAPPGTMRLVPDVAAVGDPGTGAFVMYNGAQHQVAGTSLSSPIWAAWCALMNEARAKANRPPLGALNPRLYALAGTQVFRDVTTGGNSIYQAGTGFDLTTGLGVPNVSLLLQATLSDTFAPVIEMQSGSRFTTTGQGATFYVIATSVPDPAFRWQRLVAGTTTWVDLADGTNFFGTRTYALGIAAAAISMSGDQYRCVITNAGGTITTQPDRLTVATTGVSTVAGWPGWSGFADGQGTSGRFNYTGSVRIGPDGTIYVADASNHTIRKISASGVVSTFAGAPGVSGTTDGPGSVARFNGPAGVAVDATGNVYVADSQNATIRKITPAGAVSTLAGSAGTTGNVDGTGSAARFSDPENLTLGPDGIIYVADGQGNTVRKVTPAGVVTTLAGSTTAGSTDGTGSAARFNLLAGIAVDSALNVYVGDYLNNTIRKITPAGVVTTLAGSAGTVGRLRDGLGTTARFSGPTGMAIDASGNLFVADSFNNAVRKVTPAGAVTTVAGSATQPENIDGTLDVARFNGPADVAFDALGNLYVADSLNCTIRRIALPTATPVITQQPQSQTVASGGNVTLTSAALANGTVTYQWSKDGIAIAGATADSFTVANASAASAGGYTVAATSTGTTTVSSPAIVSVSGLTPGGLTNLSVRTSAGTGAQTLSMGFVLGGTGNKTLVIRGVGPTLTTAFNVPGTLADPTLTIFGPNSQTLVAASNDNWTAADAGAMAAVGAFALTSGSRDSAVIVPVGPGAYTAQITGAGNSTGIALAEIYDTAPVSGVRLVNVSARAQVDTGAGVLIAGFTIAGNTSRTVLIRGVGPGLQQFSVPGVLVDPQVDVFASGNAIPVKSNNDWGNDSTLSAAFTQVSAFALPASSKDAALLVTLAPGSYTAQVSGVGGTTGVALVEIYDLGK
jgi:hypothetical protein